MSSVSDKIRKRKYLSGAARAAAALAIPYVILGSLRIDSAVSGCSRTELAVKSLFAAVMAAALCYTVLKIEKMAAVYKHTAKKRGFLYALYFSVYIVRLYNPADALRTQVTDMSRTIGHGLINGVDVSKRVSNFNLWFLYMAVVFVLFSLLANYCRSKEYSGENRKAAEFLDKLMILANLLQGIRCAGFFSDRFLEHPVFHYTDYLVTALIFIGIAYIGLRLEERITAEQLAKLIVSGWMFGYPVTMVIAGSPLLRLGALDFGRLLLGTQMMAFLAVLAALKFAKVRWEERKLLSATTVTVVSFSFLPFFSSFFIELTAILNQHEIFLASPWRAYLGAVVTGLILTAVLAVIVSKKDICLRRWKHIAYPAVIVGIVCLWRQAEIWKEYSPDMFESANAGILISDFLNFGDIPIVQHYGGHMMTGVWEGIIYGLLNDDFLGAAFSPYSQYSAVMTVVLFFFLVKRVLDEDMAFLTALFFPFYDYVDAWAPGILMCLTAAAYRKKPNFKKGVWFWLSFGWCTLYRLDLGFAFGAACASALVLQSVMERNKKAGGRLLASMWAVAGAAMAVWCAVCLVRNVNPWERLLEFLFISASNQNWGLGEIGNPRSFLYVWTYFFVPMGVVICLTLAVFSKALGEEGDREKQLLILILGCAYLYNYPRGLVRHSLAEPPELGMQFIVWTSCVFFAMFAADMRKNEKLFLPVLTGCILCTAQLFTGNVSLRLSAADNSVGRTGEFTENWKADNPGAEQTVIRRVRFERDFKNTVKGYEVMLDMLLEEDETFVDFINKTAVYMTSGRRDPAYVSQSPMQLSGEYAQEKFIEEIEGIPVVFMPADSENPGVSAGLDGIANPVRYYKAAEYIYQNYVPLCAYRDAFAVWCLRDRYEEMKEKVKEFMENGMELKNGLVSPGTVLAKHTEMVSNGDGTVTIRSAGSAPGVWELQELFDMVPYINDRIDIKIHYRTDVCGALELFYTENEGEDYTEDKRLSATISGEGTACFEVPCTEWTRIRLDIPEGSRVTVKGLKIESRGCRLIDYGYDGPFPADDGELYTCLPCIHSYSLNALPRIWAEEDRKNSRDNPVAAEAKDEDGVYRFHLSGTETGTKGSYLKVGMLHEGGGTQASLKMGTYEDGGFRPKYVYTFRVDPGVHEYMFRISSDYYWYLKQVDTAILEWENGEIRQVDMKILEGD